MRPFGFTVPDSSVATVVVPESLPVDTVGELVVASRAASRLPGELEELVVEPGELAGLPADVTVDEEAGGQASCWSVENRARASVSAVSVDVSAALAAAT